MVVSILFNFFNFAAMLLLGGPEPPAPVRSDNPPELPIDSALWILLLFGLMFGIYIAFRRIKASNNPA